MPAFCLDTSAIITLRDDEPGAERVAMLLDGPDPCFACFITRMEVLVRVWIAAVALLSRATLFHRDPEFEAITELDQSWLA
jgi:predicted nucleic acid-binding protein